MRVGVMADTHDNLEATEKAIDFFNEKEVDVVLHAGDLVSPFTAAKFSELESELHIVWGNNEGDRLHNHSKLEEIGINPPEEFFSLDLDGKKVALLHGTSEHIVEALAKSNEFDIVIRGHTHEPEVREEPMVINPGPASGYLNDQCTVALLDTDEMSAEIVEL